MNLQVLQTDPQAFRNSLKIDVDNESKKLSCVVDEWQNADFKALDPGWQKVAGHSANGPLRAWLERPRGHSKTSDIATMVAWVLFASKRRINGVVCAADRDQAKLDRDAIDRIVRLNPWLSSILKVTEYKVVNVKTGSELQIISSDAPSSYGLLIDFAVLDEITIWPKRELFDSILSACAKKKNCLMLCIGNAGFRESWQYQTRELIRKDPAWYFSRLDGPVASWIDHNRLFEQRRLLPLVAYSRLWLNIWASGSGDALTETEIDRSIILDGPSSKVEKGFVYIGGLDLGLRRDASALVILGVNVGWTEEKKRIINRTPLAETMLDLGLVEDTSSETEDVHHAGTGKVKLVSCDVWNPAEGKVSLSEIEQRIIELDKVFNLQQLGFDRWQAELLAERLTDEGIPCKAIDFVPQNLKSMATQTLEAFQENRIELYDHPELVADLRALRVVEKNYGVRLVPGTTPSGTAHGDAATALAISLHTAKVAKLGLTNKMAPDLIVA